MFVLTVAWDKRAQELRSIRHAVFVEEQSVSAEEEWDGQDEHCLHFLAVNQAGVALGCARLQANGKVERMAVLEHSRHLGIGRELLTSVIESATTSGLTDLYLHAQLHAEPFYRRMGFLPEGGTFVEANIDHVRMTMPLAIPFARTIQPPIQPAASTRQSVHQSSKTEPSSRDSDWGQKNFDGREEALSALSEYLTKPRRTLYLYSQHLDSSLFDKTEVLDALSEFVRAAAQNRLRILIHSSQLAVARGHRLVELARRLESKVEIRMVPSDMANEDKTYLCWDNKGYWLLPDYANYLGQTNDADSVSATRLAAEFERTWQRSVSDPELRLLGL